MIDIQEFLEHPESLDKDSLYELRNLLAHYPYFETVRLLYLKNLYILHDPSFGEELNKSVAYITDRSFLYHYIEGEFRHRSVRKASIADEQNTEEEDRTLSLIDAFLASMPEGRIMKTIGRTTMPRRRTQRRPLRPVEGNCFHQARPPRSCGHRRQDGVEGEFHFHSRSRRRSGRAEVQ